VVIANNLSWLIVSLGGPQITTWWYTLAVSVTAIAVLTVVSLLGLGVGKWLQNLGGAAQFLTFGALIVVPFIALGPRHDPGVSPARMSPCRPSRCSV
jgi:hypothetical protein